MKYKGHPIRGMLSGLLLGVFVLLDLAIFGIRPPDAVAAYGLPALGLVVGALLGFAAPFGRRKMQQPSA